MIFCSAVVLIGWKMRDVLAALCVVILSTLAVGQSLWRWLPVSGRDTYLSDARAATYFCTSAWLLALGGIVLSILYIRRTGRRITKVADLAGLHQTHPGPAFAITVCLLSFAAAPLTAGFFGKVMLIGSALVAGWYAVAVAMLFAGFLLAAGCLRLLSALYADMYGKTPAPAEPMPGIRGQLWRLAITILVAGTIILGALPQLLMEPLLAFGR